MDAGSGDEGASSKGSGMVLRRGGTAWVGVVAGIAAVAIGVSERATPAAAGSPVSCERSGTTLTVHDGLAERLEIFRGGIGGDRIVIVSEISGLISCPDPVPTVFNIDQLNVLDESQLGGLAVTLRSPQRFRPGATNEPGETDELEIDVSLESTSSLDLFWLAHPNPVILRAGADGFNFNPSEANPDVDLTMGEQGRVAIEGGDAGDVLRADGGGGTGSPYPRRLSFSPGSGDDEVVGGSSVDRISGDPGADDLDGGGGPQDLLYFTSFSGPVDVNLAAGTATGPTVGTDTVRRVEWTFGTSAADRLVGTNGTNWLVGGEGRDILDARGGLDILEGGPGHDSAGYRRAPAGVRVDLALQDQEQDTRGGGIDTLRGIEGLSGSRLADRLLGDSARNILSGLGGNDRLYGRAGDDRLVGGRRDDLCRGGPGRDRVVECER